MLRHAPSKPSLTDILFPGPNLNSNLFDLMFKFRRNSIALVADIKNIFLQIGLAENDRDSTRFLWVDQLPHDQNISMKPEIIRMTTALFEVTSSTF
ncbi:hypothetical protein CEXT_164441 [Caerostris extrusa]|uniref:Uncharacterized protein n=1 Tax=Caerostris extrusa TaxID=172846 RepID=A0AAV4YBQ3_CAEEX|nr:hypothetical protein CEXT_164441 [Caerostris extrusa]